MNRISDFTNLSRGLLDRFQGFGRAQEKDTRPSRETRGVGEAPKAAPADVAQISPKAHRLIALRHAMDSGMKALERVPEIRQDRIAEARARLDHGFYNSIEVRSRVAERLDMVTRQMEDI